MCSDDLSLHGQILNVIVGCDSYIRFSAQELVLGSEFLVFDSKLSDFVLLITYYGAQVPVLRQHLLCFLLVSGDDAIELLSKGKRLLYFTVA